MHHYYIWFICQWQISINEKGRVQNVIAWISMDKNFKWVTQSVRETMVAEQAIT